MVYGLGPDKPPNHGRQMKADIFALQPLFQKDVRYLIRTFPRPYVDDQWEPLWNDVRGTAERYIEEQQHAGAGNDAAALDATPQVSCFSTRIWTN